MYNNYNDNILIIDHNITRLHHFDLMESMIYHKPMFDLLKPEYLFYLDLPVEKRYRYFFRENKIFNILDFFNDKNNHTIEEYNEILNKMVDYSGKKSKTPFGSELILLGNLNINKIFLYQIEKDINTYRGKNLHILKTDNLFDTMEIVKIIKMNNMKVVILDNAEFALKIGKYTEGVTYLIQPYGYNLRIYGKKRRHYTLLQEMTDDTKNEYASFNY